MKGCKTVKPFASADKLSLDIFMGILEAVESKGDLLSFLITCRTLYTQGKHLMLRNLRINASNLESFYAYMHSHAPASFERLRDLHISIPVEYEGTQLVDILEQSNTNIQGLFLSSSLKLGVYRAITSLTNLQTLDLSEVYSDYWIENILCHLASSLTELVIVLHFYRGVLPFLSRSCRSLKRLSLCCDVLPSADGPLSSLVMLNLKVRLYPQLSDLMATFPNLQDLRIREHTDQSSQDLALLRKQNLVFQYRGHRWTSLRRLSANVSLLYAMALQIDLDMLSVTTPIVPADQASGSPPDSPKDSLSYSSENPPTGTSEGPLFDSSKDSLSDSAGDLLCHPTEDLLKMESILSMTRPKALNLALHFRLAEHFKSTLAPKLADTVDLSLQIYSPDDSLGYVQPVTEEWFTVLRGLPVQSLKLRIRVPYNVVLVKDPVKGAWIFKEIFPKTLAAKRIKERMPLLRYLRLCVDEADHNRWSATAVYCDHRLEDQYIETSGKSIAYPNTPSVCRNTIRRSTNGLQAWEYR